MGNRRRWVVVVTALLLVVLLLSWVAGTGEDDVAVDREPAPETDDDAEPDPDENGEDDPDPSEDPVAEDPEPADEPPADPVEQAEAFLADLDMGRGDDDIPPESVAFLDYISRRWNRAPVVDPAAARAELLDADETFGLARFFDPGVDVSQSAAWDLVPPLGAALFCDRHGFPDGYADLLRRYVEEGEYLASHVLLVLGITDELGCEVPDGAEIREAAINRVAFELGATEEVSDLSAQQIAYLDYVGELGRVDPVWEQRLVDTQLADGGWPQDPTSELGRWHTTGPGWWALLAFRDEGDRGTRMVRG